MAQRSVRYRAGFAQTASLLLSLVLSFSTSETLAGATVHSSQECSRMSVTVGDKRFVVTLEDNPTVRELTRMLPVTFNMTELNGNEKLVRLPRSMTTSEIRPGTIRTGDVLLYGNNTLVVFYETFQSSYSYTRIGRIEDPAGLAEALGPGNPRVTFAAP